MNDVVQATVQAFGGSPISRPISSKPSGEARVELSVGSVPASAEAIDKRDQLASISMQQAALQHRTERARTKTCQFGNCFGTDVRSRV